MTCLSTTWQPTSNHRIMRQKRTTTKQDLEDVNGEQLTVKKWWIFGADFFTVYAEFFTVCKEHKRWKKTISLLIWSFSRLAFHGLPPLDRRRNSNKTEHIVLVWEFSKTICPPPISSTLFETWGIGPLGVMWSSFSFCCRLLRIAFCGSSWDRPSFLWCKGAYARNPCINSQSRGPKISANFSCAKIFKNPSGHGRPQQQSWMSAPKCAVLQLPMMGRNFLTLGHPGARVKNICGISGPKTLKTLTSLNKEVRPFLLSDNSIWSLPSVSSLSDYSIWRSWRLF